MDGSFNLVGKAAGCEQDILPNRTYDSNRVSTAISGTTAKTIVAILKEYCQSEVAFTVATRFPNRRPGYMFAQKNLD